MNPDIAGLSALLVFMRYMHNNQVEEQMLMCKPLPVHSMEDTFKLTDSYMTDKGFCWKDCVDVCRNGAQLMMGKARGFIAYAKSIALACTNHHCIFIIILFL
jgi:hypothetical protein